MIEINLIPGKKQKAARGKGLGFKLAVPGLRELIASIKYRWLIAASASAVVVIGVGLLLFITLSTRLRVLQSNLDAVRIEKRRFDAGIAQKRQSERIRDSLVAEIGIIRGIDAHRYIWPHMLDQITKALPPYTWLTSIAVAGGSNVAPGSPGATAAGGAVDSVGVPIVRAWITGGTGDIQAYTTVLRQLAPAPGLLGRAPAVSLPHVQSE